MFIFSFSSIVSKKLYIVKAYVNKKEFNLIAEKACITFKSLIISCMTLNTLLEELSEQDTKKDFLSLLSELGREDLEEKDQCMFDEEFNNYVDAREKDGELITFDNGVSHFLVADIKEELDYFVEMEDIEKDQDLKAFYEKFC